MKFSSLGFHDTVYCTAVVLPLSLSLSLFLSSLLISFIILFLNVCASFQVFILCFSLNIHCLTLFQMPSNCAWLPKPSPGPNTLISSFHLQISAGYFLLLVSPKLNPSWNKFTTFATLPAKWLVFWIIVSVSRLVS